ncbi:MAG TPA: site-2 protease family protein [Planctomycetota bacterium]|nr:site-2 protease family protein [Planctomycetota bacterium]HRR81476.1 site-2 protease family protein [Planctomycetota bacterium]HRT93753.1 site-2 protease family protein [Planctomycetota bacterium]
MPDFDLTLFVLRIPPLLFALTIHEFAYGWSAYLCGDPTAKHLGRLTFNPLAHLDPIGALCLLFAPFGWAKPVPVNPYNFRHPRRDDILVSLAGVAANLATAVVVALLLRAFPAAPASEIGRYFWIMLFILLQISVGLALFNLIPIPPLDGSHVLRNLLPREQAIAYERLAPAMSVVFLVLIVSRAIDLVLLPPHTFLVRLLLGS